MHIDPLGTSAWNTVLSGRKLWVLFPPHVDKSVAKGTDMIRQGEDDEPVRDSRAHMQGGASQRDVRLHEAGSVLAKRRGCDPVLCAGAQHEHSLSRLSRENAEKRSTLVASSRGIKFWRPSASEG